MTELNKIFVKGILLKAAKAFNEKAPAVFMVKVPREGTKAHDFIPVKAFGELKEYALRNLYEGVEIELYGTMQSGSYTNKENKKVYTLDVVASEIKVLESTPQRKAW